MSPESPLRLLDRAVVDAVFRAVRVGMGANEGVRWTMHMAVYDAVGEGSL